jgi:hypothetical protein
MNSIALGFAVPAIATIAFGDDGRSTYVVNLGARIDLSRFGDPPHFNAALAQ